MDEICKDIEGYEGLYVVYRDGRVYSYPRTKTPGGFLVSNLINDYVRITLIKSKTKQKIVSAHRLVAKAFIPNPENKPQVNHKNGIKTDNRVENLEWVTRQENMQHCLANGIQLGNKGEKNWKSKLSEVEALELLQLDKMYGLSRGETAREYGVSHSCIAGILNGWKWKHLKYKI